VLGDEFFFAIWDDIARLTDTGSRPAVDTRVEEQKADDTYERSTLPAVQLRSNRNKRPNTLNLNPPASAFPALMRSSTRVLDLRYLTDEHAFTAQLAYLRYQDVAEKE